MVSKTFPASLDQLSEMLYFVRSMVKELEFELSEAIKIEVAVEEALVNVINYAYPKDTGEVQISCDLTETGIQIVIIDEGISFDPIAHARDKYPSPSVDVPGVGGYGVQLIIQVMDHVKYYREDKKNILRITKNK